jgi:hypothetical protein
MPEAVPKTPLSVPELATRAATYGALFAVATALFLMMMWLNEGQTKRVERVSAEVSDLRKEVVVLRQDLNALRVEFVEFRAETRAEFKAIHVELDGIHNDLAEIKQLLKARPSR